MPNDVGQVAQSQDAAVTRGGGNGPIIRLEKVCKSFGPLKVLDHLDLTIERGRTTVIIGPSGVGKSVLIKHIVGLERADSGAIWFEDQRVDQLGEADLVAVRRRIGYLFQMGALFDSMTVRDNICFPLVQHTTMTPKAMNERCAAVLEMVGLAGIERQMPASLSGGQRKRVALARAIVLEPDVVLYDEPTTGLDPIRADVINELINELAQRLGITSIAVTHDMASARKIADRMVMLYDGHIVADGEPEAFLAAPNELVQRFIRGEAEPALLDAIRQNASRVRPGTSTKDG